MTVKALHKLLGALIEQGHGRKPVLVNKPTFEHNLEGDGCVMLDVCGIEKSWVYTVDEDGGTKINQDGSESGRTCVVLYGSGHEPGGAS